MPDQYIVEHCSPTLAGIKTANLFSIKIEKMNDVNVEIRELNSKLRDKGLRAIPVKKTKGYVLIYLYRPDFLANDLENPEVQEILEGLGYECDKPEQCIVKLINNLAKNDSFPHEIGLFLGYPPCDVRGFMKNPKEGVKCSGCWKVYGDVKKAEETFERYKKCTNSFMERLASGSNLSQLVVRA
ncbi:MAG: DUF3793 family protein [Lachnospiraceae bacterium]|nr:DUF3793 family protein [Lachnospiraceae bacterium]